MKEGKDESLEGCIKCKSNYYYTNKDGVRVCRKCGYRFKVGD